MPLKNYNAITVRQDFYDKVKDYLIKIEKATGKKQSISSFTQETVSKAIQGS